MTKSLLPTSEGVCQRCQTDKRLTVSATYALKIAGGEHRLCTNHAAAASHQHGIAHPVFNPKGEVMKP